jgi:hypothetical protein
VILPAADRVYDLDKGRVVFRDAPQEPDARDDI